MPVKVVHIVSLGCPKNLVDSEVIAASLTRTGYRLTDRPEEAEVIVVNTCGFIEPAKEESIEEILRMAAWKAGGKGPCTHLVVTGCLAQRYGKELAAALPEVDLFLGINETPRLSAHLASLCVTGPVRQHSRTRIGRPTYLMTASDRSGRSLLSASAYLKIADGCSNCCAYCAIPMIRGKARSRPMDDILREAGELADRGVREVIITAQDTTAYGADLKGKPTLALLLEELARINGIAWIRLLYTYPAHLSEALFRTMAASDKICHYLDVPIQHCDPAVLVAMRRQGDKALIRCVIAQARSLVPDIALRTSLIVGFPGETWRRFEHLLDFTQEIRFDHLGVFTYSREEGTPAASLPSRISEQEKERRRGLVLEQQQRISLAINQSLIGSRQEILVEGQGELEGWDGVGRCRRQAPEVDGVTYLRGVRTAPGQLLTGRIIAADDYDLYAEPL